MNDRIELKMIVTKVSDVKAKDDSVTVTMKGAKTVVHENYDNGYDVEDVVEINMTVKCGMMATMKKLSMSEYEDFKTLLLKNRDAALTDFVGDAVPIET